MFTPNFQFIDSGYMHELASIITKFYYKTLKYRTCMYRYEIPSQMKEISRLFVLWKGYCEASSAFGQFKFWRI